MENDFIFLNSKILHGYYSLFKFENVINNFSHVILVVLLIFFLIGDCVYFVHENELFMFMLHFDKKKSSYNDVINHNSYVWIILSDLKGLNLVKMLAL